MGSQEISLSKEDLIERIQNGFPYAEEYHSLNNKRMKLEKAKGTGWIIYFAMFFVAGFIGNFSMSIGGLIFTIHFLGGFLWLPKIYGKIFSRLANNNKIRNVNLDIEDLCNEFTEKTGIFYEYMTIYSLERLEKYIVSGRADTLKEAYNLLEDEMRRDGHLAIMQQQHKEAMHRLSSIESEVSMTRMNSYRD
ncbi:MAG: hypothetical protein ABGX20_18765 [Bacillus sp. (in: firmicutes)]